MAVETQDFHAREKAERDVYWIWLQGVFGCGSHRANAIAAKFTSAREIYGMGREQRSACGCFTPAEIGRMAAPLEKAAAILERCAALGCHVLTPEDEGYPDRLRNIYAMPLTLYVKGDLGGIDDQLAITMVGTRKSTEYGLYAANLLAGQLAGFGAVVISGCALGIDSACIRGAVRKGGRTVGVIGSGIDVPYPRGNEKMLDWIGAHHALVTEYPPGTPPMAANFPQRNRIMSGLGLGTVVVEAGRKSGALITAQHALEQGKDVFAVPGRINDPCSQGALDLIRQGARAVCGAQDILMEYEHLYPEQLRELYEIQLEKQREHRAKPQLAGQGAADRRQTPIPPPPDGLDERQKAVYGCLGYAPEPSEVLARRGGLSVNELLPVLTELEIMGIACSPLPRRYALAPQAGADGENAARE